jgi:GT2 family glycosyltransferase
VYVLLLNWRTAAHTLECLETIFRLRHPDVRVVVCDNGSDDDSLARIRAWAEGGGDAVPAVHEALRPLFAAPLARPIPFVEYDRAQAEAGGGPEPEGTRLVLVRNGENLGFTAGNNVGFRYALARGDADWVWMLNNDTVVAPDALDALLAAAGDDPRVGMVGSKLLFYDEPDVVQAAAGGVLTRWQGTTRLLGGEPDRGQWDDLGEPEYIHGASLLARGEVLREVGLLDERYFIYSEEVDWCLRTRAAGFRLAYAPGSRVWHKEGRSIGQKSAFQDYHAVRSKLLLVQKHFPALLPAALLHTAWRSLLPKVVRLQPQRLKAVLRAYRDFFAYGRGR